MPLRARLLPLSLAIAVPLVAVCAGGVAASSDSSELSRISDSRIQESSGLVISSVHDDLAYTINDAGNDPVVYAIQISTGDVTGTTRVGGGDIEDTESLAIDGEGTMWLSDLGDNDAERDNVALYAFPEPGPDDQEVTAKRYPVTYEAGAVDIEAFLVHPKTGAKFLASKNKESNGLLFSLPESLSTSSPNVATDLGKSMPQDVSDGTFTPDGSQVLIRTRKAVHVFDPESWKEIRKLSVPEVEQGESIAMDPDGGSFIIGSEGEDSPLIRVAYTPEGSGATLAPDELGSPSQNETGDVGVPVYLVAGAAVVAVVALAAWVVNRRHRGAA